MACLAGPRRPTVPRFELVVVTAVAFVGVLTFYGRNLNAEEELQWVAAQIRSASAF